MSRKPIYPGEKLVRVSAPITPTQLAHLTTLSIKRFGKPNVAAYLRHLVDTDLQVHRELVDPPGPLTQDQLVDPHDPQATARLTEWAKANGPFLVRSTPDQGAHWRWGGMRTDAPRHHPQHDSGVLLRDWLYDNYRLQEHIDRRAFPLRHFTQQAVPACGHPACINPKHMTLAKSFYPVLMDPKALENLLLSPSELGEALALPVLPEGPPLVGDDGVANPVFLP